MKKCSKCHESFDISQFYPKDRGRYLQSWCKGCEGERQKSIRINKVIEFYNRLKVN